MVDEISQAHLYLFGDNLDILIIIAAYSVSAFTAYSFFKAAKFKATASKETMLQAGFGWLEKLPVSVARVIAYLELLGAAGLLIAPVGYLLGYEWAIWFAVAAGAGLALTMVGAIWLHAARKESQYTLKMNLQLLAVSVMSASFWALLPMF
jgi:hypothetical protein